MNINKFGDLTIINSSDAERFLSNFVWNVQFNFDINSLVLEQAPSHFTKEGKLRFALRRLFKDNDAIKRFLLNNCHPEIIYGNSPLAPNERISLMVLLENCIEYLNDDPLRKENLINSLINSYNHKKEQEKKSCKYNEVDHTWNDFIKDSNEQFKSMMNDMDAWCNIE